jgi:hypothetical protein
MPAGPDDAGQVIPIIDPAGVRRAPRVPDQERADSEVGECLPFLLGFVHRATGVEPDMAVRIDQTRKYPSGGHRFRRRDRLVCDPAIHDVDVARILRRQGYARDPQDIRGGRWPVRPVGH